MSTRRFFAAFGAFAALAMSAVGCVRLQEPDQFACFGSDDCGDDGRCDFARNVCVDKGSCSYSSDCELGQRCESGRCAPAECIGASECGNYDCAEGKCQTTCTPPANGCQSGLKCQSGACVPRQHLENGQPCTVSLDCASNVCCDDRCADRCGSTGTSCSSGDECSSGHCCAEGDFSRVCSPIVCAPLEAGERCADDADCKSGNCAGGFCATRSCMLDADCELYFCAAGKCEAERRAIGAECATDTWCQSGSCMGAGETCSLTIECEASLLCCEVLDGSATKRCSSQAVCPGSIGGSCSSSTMCMSEAECVASVMCSKSCTNDVDCGMNPWGQPNHCVLNDADEYLCFSSCGTGSEDHCGEIDEDFSCQYGYDFREDIVLVCAGIPNISDWRIRVY